MQYPRLRFNWQEFSGSFGDIGTDLPLLIGLITVAHLSSANVFTLFGLGQVLSGVIYGLPMPLQPLKAMAVIVMTQKLSGQTLWAGGFLIALIMLVLSLSGALSWLARVIPLPVVRGCQFGLGLSLASLALKTYIPEGNTWGYLLAGLGFLILVALPKQKGIPAGLVVVGLGLLYACSVGLPWSKIALGIHWQTPEFQTIDPAALLPGLFLLALPQLPLSISNAVIATQQTAEDLFPEKPLSIRQIGLTYGLVNLIVPFFGGVPVCHGCGGLVGHYALGARTGGAVVIYGGLYLIVGLLFSAVFNDVLGIFPMPILGVILLFEAWGLLSLIGDQVQESQDWMIALLVAVIAFSVPQGFLISTVVGTGLYYLGQYTPLNLQKVKQESPPCQP
ncbi:putative sulfate/molybdate transporter [Thermosynechococcaceae cyanobacterium BACA0444]|uniref:Sulfate/molybdate transporter n=1 Tax=Pseudocalidococcus azoricus BACA0444 TaxID=2918990 RepID=A0AAE4JZ69_9CYAN|nr:putative sulfate/molybdate transporter [Pseudocalidococcus azoricus]MDS3860502.1 putative sulfate/molybdate transporter [Pseudocalidococcus azoricus BACA0444]